MYIHLRGARMPSLGQMQSLEIPVEFDELSFHFSAPSDSLTKHGVTLITKIGRPMNVPGG
jgi:hypothetical protein